jgi:alpha-galactosidase
VYLNLDDGWSERNRTADGRLAAHRAKFPSGIKALADYVHGKGLKFGIYGDAGQLTCAKYPGSLGFEEVDAQTFAEWGERLGQSIPTPAGAPCPGHAAACGACRSL